MTDDDDSKPQDHLREGDSSDSCDLPFSPVLHALTTNSLYVNANE